MLQSRWRTLGILLLVGVAAEWIRGPSQVWALVASLAALTLVWGIGRTGDARRSFRWLTIGALLALSLTLLLSQRRLDAIESRWSEIRESRIRDASTFLARDLRAALHQVEKVATAAAAVDSSDRAGAFESLADALPAGGPEIGVAILERTGVPWAWAGRHLFLPQMSGDSIGVTSNPLYLTLETRRHIAEGRTVVASVLVWAHQIVPETDRSIAQLFEDRTGVALSVYPAGAAPHSPDVFDYEQPTTAGPRLLFSVRPEPPEQGAAKQAAQREGRRLAAWLLLVLIAGALGLARGIAGRLGLLLSLLYVAVRSPAGEALGLETLFSPATFFRDFLGPLSGSAGVLAMTGALATGVAIILWRRRLPRRPWTVGLGVLLLAGAPYLISELGRGITPPADGVPMGLWITWQLTLVLASSAVIIFAAALFRGADGRVVPVQVTALGAALAVAAAVVGLLVWNPRFGWEDWYPLLWTPALILVTLPAARWATVLGIALVAGTSSALVTWGAELNGRLEVVQRDVSRLGDFDDPLAEPVLDRFAEQLGEVAPPRDEAGLYALWQGSVLGDQSYPTRLALWTRDGVRQAELPLDSLDVPLPLLSALVRGMDSSATRVVTPVLRVPGVYHVLLARTDSGTVLTAVIGPRTRLIGPDRLGRLLRGPPPGYPLYDLSLSPPAPGAQADSLHLRWRREDWVLRSERRILLPGGVRHVHAHIDLRGPAPLLVRGSLIVLLDAGLLGLLWAVTDSGMRRPPWRWPWRRVMRSFQVRTALALAAFFILPAVGFAGWSFARLSSDAQRGRDLLIRQALRDAVLTAGGLLQSAPESVEEGLHDLATRLDADFALYSGGSLLASSEPLLQDLGMVEPLADPKAFQTLALRDELEITEPGPVEPAAMRVGYRLVRAGPPGGIGILATTQLAADPSLTQNQTDLALILLLATTIGLACALAGAQLAARTLSRPVAELGAAAVAVGQGRPLTRAHAPPTEFEAVFGAFDRMATDVRTSQQALEDARRRTATVLATVATGVIALDPEGRVLLANQRAEEMLGTTLPEGTPLDLALGPVWSGLKGAIGRFLLDPAAAPGTVEFEGGGRRYRLQLAVPGADLRGVVIALDDLTDVTQAARVLAWGELARQVAHEVKNPLTPIRLGVQHLRRVYRDGHDAFAQTLDETSKRILAEIDRLDTIARAFSRFSAPVESREPLEPVRLLDMVREVAALYSLGEAGSAIDLSGEPNATAPARKDEVKEVLGNLFENARHAGARRIRVEVAPGLMTVEDDGGGIAPDLLPRIFEPHFSTTTSGTGLGLAIVRRLVEGWGATIEVTSEVGKGTRLEVRWGRQLS